MQPRNRVRPEHRGRRAVCIALALTTILGLDVAARVPAGAVTEDSLRAQAAALTTRISQLGQQEAAVDEQYNQARIALTAAEAKENQAKAAEAQAANEVQSRKTVLVAASVDAYMRGGDVGAVTVLLQSSQQNYEVQQTYLRSVSDNEQAAIDGLQEAQARLKVQEAQLAAATQVAQGAVNQISSTRNQLQSTVSAERSALAQAQGQLAQMVAADQAAAAAAAAREAAARQAAAAAAAAAEAGRRGSGGGNDAGITGNGAVPITAPPQSGAAGVALQWAQRELGKPYEYGAAGPDSFDCSGLMMYIFGQAGVSLPHSAAGQWDDTTRISYAQAQPGDLVFFYQPVDHVGIYIGNGEMIDAPHTGANVEYDPIWWQYLDGFGRVSA